jgi:hypothetical protein
MGMWNTNEYRTETMYFYYIVMKIYVIVCTNIYSLIYFQCITILSQPSSYHGFHTFTNYAKTFEDSYFNSLDKFILYNFPFLQQIVLIKWKCFSKPKHSLIY